MTTDALLLAQWLSPSFPVSAFAYSHGLERAIEAGDVTNAASLQAWLSYVLEQGAGVMDIALLRAAYHGDPAADEHAVAMAASAERLFEMRTQGAAFAKTVRDVWGLEVPDQCYPVAVGLAAGIKGLDPDLTARMYLQSWLSNLTQAAQRLMPLGQTNGQLLLRDLMLKVPAVAERGLKTRLDDLSATAFLADIRSMQHETQHHRIFRT